jgi:hypothetical protein
VIAEDGGGFGRLKGGVVLALGPTLKRLRELFRPMFLIELDLVLRDWWLSRLANASWLEVSSALKTGTKLGKYATGVTHIVTLFDWGHLM